MTRILQYASAIFSTIGFITRLSLYAALQPSGFVNDYAGILTQWQKTQIENKIKDYENRTGIEIAVVILNSLEGKSIEEFSNEIFNTWGIGKKNKDNGILMLISLAERKIRIEVGYGIEGVLTDGKCGSIIRNRIAPEFKKGRYFEGIEAGIDSIESFTSGESTYHESTFFPFLIVWQLFCLFFALIVAGLTGAMIIILETGILDILLTLGFSNQMVFNTALFLPFFTCFILFFIAFIFNVTDISRNKKFSKSRFPLLMSSRAGRWHSSGGGFGGGTSGGAGASGTW